MPQLHIYGTRGSFPVNGTEFHEFGPATSCYVLKDGGYALVMEAGTGLFTARELLKGCATVDILLSHLHYDHTMGILTPGAFVGVNTRFFGPFSNWGGSNAFRSVTTNPYWPVPYPPQSIVVDDVVFGEPVSLPKGFSVTFDESDHPNDGSRYAIEYQGKRICFSGDYEHGKLDLTDWARDCDLLIYDGMYCDETYPGHEGWGHSTWEEGCKLAAAANAKQLLITHHDPMSTDEHLREQEARAKEMFPATTFARIDTIIEF